MTDLQALTLYRGMRTNPSEEDIKESNGWCYGGITSPNHHPEGKVQIVSCEDLEDGSRMVFIDVIRETVGKYTGLNDKNDKEIYAGSKLIDSNGAPYEVRFGDGKFYVIDEFPDIIDLNRESIRIYGFEVIGNIHENQEDNE